jgi:hypothetical protein
MRPIAMMTDGARCWNNGTWLRYEKFFFFFHSVDAWIHSSKETVVRFHMKPISSIVSAHQPAQQSHSLMPSMMKGTCFKTTKERRISAPLPLLLHHNRRRPRSCGMSCIARGRRDLGRSERYYVWEGSHDRGTNERRGRCARALGRIAGQKAANYIDDIIRHVPNCCHYDRRHHGLGQGEEP